MMREIVLSPEPDNRDQLFMFPDAPVVPVQASLDLPLVDPAEPEPDAHPDLFIEQPTTASSGQVQYYLMEAETPSGPFSQQDVISRLQNRSLTPEIYVWHEELDDWQTLARLFPEYSSSAIQADRFASFGRRFAAGTIDLALLLAAYFIAMIALPPFRDWIEASSLSKHGLIVANLVLSGAIYPYFLLFLGPAGRGRTPGYRLMRIRLMDELTHDLPTWTQASLWCAGSLLMLVGWPLYWLDPSNRMLHNRLSRTIVVNNQP